MGLIGTGDLFDLFHDAGVVGRNYLRAIAPVDLIAIILWGVVGCGDHHRCGALMVAASKRDKRGGAELFGEEGGDPVSS